MNQISRLPPSSVCYYFSFRHCDKSFICSRCLGPHKYFAVDHLWYSTYESALVKHTVKTKKGIGSYEKKLKETELLKVTNKQATQKTMTVGKLSASLVTAFAKEPGMILNDTGDSKYKRKKRAFSGEHQKEQNHSIFRSENNFNKVDKSTLRTSKRCPEVITDPKKCYSCATNNHHTQDCSNFYMQPVTGTNNSATIAPNNSSDIPEEHLNPSHSSLFKTLKNEKGVYGNCEAGELENENSFSKALEESSISSSCNLNSLFDIKNSAFDDLDNNDQLVLSMVDVFANNGMLDDAYELLHRHKMKNVCNSSIYDVVLKGYSEKGDWTRVQKVLRLMEDQNISPSCVSFAYSLNCLYRTLESERYKRQKAMSMLTLFKSMGYKIADLFQNTTITNYERENILQIVRWFFPNFEPSSPSFTSQHGSRLVADLYDKDYAVTRPLPHFKPNVMAQAIEEQLNLESKPFCEVESIVQRGTSCPKHREDWLNMVELWKNNLDTNFRRYLHALKQQVIGRNHLPNIYPFLTCLSVEDFVNLMLHEINHFCLTSEGFTLSTSVIYKIIGRRVWHRYCVKKKIKNNELMGKYKDFINMYSSWYLEANKSVKSARQKWLMMMWDNPDLMSMAEKSIMWPDPVKTKVGKFLFDIILKSAVIPPSLMSSKSDQRAVPAFYLVLRCKSGSISEQLKLHPFVGLLYRRANLNTLFFDADQLPMFCPPKPWTSVDSGGFYILESRLLRPTQYNYNIKMLRSVRSRNLCVVFDSLNQLQSVPWVVNKVVLDIAIKVFKEGGSKELNVPIYPDMSPIPEPQDHLNSNERAAAYKERLQIIKQRHEYFGLWCDGLYKLSLANHFRNKIFWLPHNMDFRGRVYPVPPHVNHISSDLYRSLFLFAKKERLGEKGLDWLKIHAINLTGALNKRPISERLEHANYVLDDILDSAEKPLDGRRWWTKSEEPWQTLAACIEINNAIKSRNPEKYETGFPVHQDGSCNGLQHYAALGRDSIGAASVNLEPADEPQDVYSVVANIIEGIRKKDAQEGIEIASVLEGFVTRKTVKQTVMTIVYGVTPYGAKLQIMNRLKEKSEFPSERINEAGRYLSVKVFEALREMFTSAKEIQDWFLKCASIITGPYKSSVSWVTPLGLPVVQPYFKNLTSSRHNNLLPDKRKQKNAFPPNFIHSLDSCHMMLTALYCGKAGLCFASVHDCFWTHPSKVDVMNTICREKFIALHSEEILNDLSDHFLRTYQTSNSKAIHPTLMEIPKRGDFDLKRVLDSVYFFS